MDTKEIFLSNKTCGVGWCWGKIPLMPDRKPEIDTSKREFFKWVLFGVGAITITGLGLAPLLSSRQVQDDEQYRKELKSWLGNLDGVIYQNPVLFEGLVPQIGARAIDYFCKEMGYNPRRYDGKLFFHWDEEYQAVLAQNSGCIKGEPYGHFRSGGVVQFGSEAMHFNLTSLLFVDPLVKSIDHNAATTLFFAVTHEAHHATPPTITLPTPDRFIDRELMQAVEMTRKKGLTSLVVVNPDGPTSDQCTQLYGTVAEEAVVEDSNLRMAQRLWLEPFSEGNMVHRAVRIYRDKVLNRWFPNHYRMLLDLQQQTKEQEFFALIGQKLGAGSKDAYDVGYNYLAQSFMPVIAPAGG